MKKFEEELFSKVPCKFGLNTEGEYKQSILIKHFKDWISPEDHQAEIEKIELQNLKYREEIERMQKSLRKKNKAIKELNGAIKKSKARLKAWHSDEEFQLLLRDRDTLKQGNDNLFKNHLELVRENDELKSQPKQQALPEIPEFVADEIEEKNRRFSDFHKTANIEGYVKDVRDWYYEKPYHAELFYRAILDGYTVAKEKRFYLKNKLTGDCLARCLARGSDGLYVEVTEKWLTRKEQTSYKLSFTQQEIDSLETGSYEKIEVEE